MNEAMICTGLIMLLFAFIGLALSSYLGEICKWLEQINDNQRKIIHQNRILTDLQRYDRDIDGLEYMPIRKRKP